MHTEICSATCLLFGLLTLNSAALATDDPRLANLLMAYSQAYEQTCGSLWPQVQATLTNVRPKASDFAAGAATLAQQASALNGPQAKEDWCYSVGGALTRIMLELSKRAEKSSGG
jgi:hypothetical protein